MSLLAEITAYCDLRGITPRTFGTYAVNNQRFVTRLEQGAIIKQRTITKVRNYIADHPPSHSAATAWAARRRGKVMRHTIDATIIPPPDRVHRDPCFNCGVRHDVHAELGCKRWRAM